MNRDDKFAELIRAADDKPAFSTDLERRVMIEVARRAIAHSQRRARRGLIASLSGLAMLLAGCVAALVVWFPTILPAFADRSWLEGLRTPMQKLFDAAGGAGVAESSATLPFFEQWGGLLLTILLAGAAVGFVYYINSLFSNDYTPD